MSPAQQDLPPCQGAAEHLATWHLATWQLATWHLAKYLLASPLISFRRGSISSRKLVRWDFSLAHITWFNPVPIQIIKFTWKLWKSKEYSVTLIFIIHMPFQFCLDPTVTTVKNYVYELPNLSLKLRSDYLISHNRLCCYYRCKPKDIEIHDAIN